MGRLNRRQFLQRGSLAVAAAGVATAVPGVVASLDDAAPALAPDTTAVEGAAPSVSEPLVARVTNASTGEIQMFFGTNSTKVTDPGLASQLLRAAR